MDDRICTQEDEFVLEILDREARWVATLSNGLVIFQDDGRYCQKDPAWLRLGNYCRKNSVKITNLRIQFRSNIIDFNGYDGYYFTKGAGADLFVGRTEHFFVIGLLKSKDLTKTWWRTPEMEKGRVDIESLEDVLKGEFAECLI